MPVNEPEFARLARQYIGLLDRANNMKPPGWSQKDHSAEVAWKDQLLNQMRAALGQGS